MRVIFREQFFPVSIAMPNINVEQYLFMLAKFAEHNLTPVQIELTEIEGDNFKRDLDRRYVESGKECVDGGYDIVAGIRVIYERPCHTATAHMLREQALHLQSIQDSFASQWTLMGRRHGKTVNTDRPHGIKPFEQ